MFVSDHTEVIDERQRLITTGVLDPEEAYEDDYIDDDGADLDEEDKSGLVEAGVSTVVTEVIKKEVD